MLDTIVSDAIDRIKTSETMRFKDIGVYSSQSHHRDIIVARNFLQYFKGLLWNPSIDTSLPGIRWMKENRGTVDENFSYVIPGYDHVTTIPLQDLGDITFSGVDGKMFCAPVLEHELQDKSRQALERRRAYMDGFLGIAYANDAQQLDEEKLRFARYVREDVEGRDPIEAIVSLNWLQQAFHQNWEHIEYIALQSIARSRSILPPVRDARIYVPIEWEHSNDDRTYFFLEYIASLPAWDDQDYKITGKGDVVYKVPPLNLAVQNWDLVRSSNGTDKEFPTWTMPKISGDPRVYAARLATFYESVLVTAKKDIMHFLTLNENKKAGMHYMIDTVGKISQAAKSVRNAVGRVQASRTHTYTIHL